MYMGWPKANMSQRMISPRSGASRGQFRLDSFKVIEGFIDWDLALQETEC